MKQLICLLILINLITGYSYAQNNTISIKKKTTAKSISKIDFNYGISLRKQNVNSDANYSPNNLLNNTTRYPNGGSKVMDAAIYTQFKYRIFKNTDVK